MSALVREALEHLTKTSERREEARREIQAMIGSFGGSNNPQMPQMDADWKTNPMVDVVRRRVLRRAAVPSFSSPVGLRVA